MRLLFSTIGSRGDVQPIVALSSHLKSVGHEVRICVPPDFRRWIDSLGIPVTTIGPEVRRFAASRPSATQLQKPLTAEQRRQMTEATVATQFETLTSAARECDVIVAATALQVAARSVAEKMGISYVFAAYAPVVLPSPHHAPPRSGREPSWSPSPNARTRAPRTPAALRSLARAGPRSSTTASAWSSLRDRKAQVPLAAAYKPHSRWAPNRRSRRHRNRRRRPSRRSPSPRSASSSAISGRARSTR